MRINERIHAVIMHLAQCLADSKSEVLSTIIFNISLEQFSRVGLMNMLFQAKSTIKMYLKFIYAFNVVFHCLGGVFPFSLKSFCSQSES